MARTGSLVPVSLVFAIFAIADAQRPDFEVPPFARNRLFHYSFGWPVTRFLNEQRAASPAISSTKIILEHIAYVEKATLASLTNRTLPGPGDPLRVCNSDRKTWLNSVRNHFGGRGWAEPNLDCVTELHGVRVSAQEKPPYSLDEVYNAVVTRGRTIDSLAKNISDLVVGNWTKPELIYNSPFNKLSQRCFLHPVGAARVKGHWHIVTSITNAPKDQQLPNFGRQFLIEYQRVGPDGKFVKPALMRLRRRPEDGIPNFTYENTTTSLGSWRGPATPSFFGNTFEEDNLAVLDALDGTDLLVQQAEDAMTPSGIAILALPLLLNVVPIALLADVGTMFMLFYILLSDVLTAIPICIKGAELIFIGRKRERAIVLRLSSTLDGQTSETAAGELWAAQCRSNRNVLTTGIIFVVLSVVFIVFGVGAEFVARKYVKRRKELRKRRLVEANSLLVCAEDASTPKRASFAVGAPSRTSGGPKQVKDREV